MSSVGWPTLSRSSGSGSGTTSLSCESAPASGARLTKVARSRFGVVVLLHAFFAKNWPQYELDGFVTQEMTGEQIILPLWNKITKAEVIGYSPSLADKLVRSTSDFTVKEIAELI